MAVAVAEIFPQGEPNIPEMTSVRLPLLSLVAAAFKVPVQELWVRDKVAVLPLAVPLTAPEWDPE